MERTDLYKNNFRQHEYMRSKRHKEITEIQRSKRKEVINVRRVRHDDTAVERKVTKEEVEVAAANMFKKIGDMKSHLQLLRHAFASDLKFINTFLKISGSMPSVVGHLSGNDSSLQLEAAWLLTNMAAGTDKHAMQVLKQAGAYLVTFLSSSNHHMQDQCAWAVGNIAGGNSKLRNMLRQMGAEKPLVDMLQSPHKSVVQSAAFALKNLCQDSNNVRNIVAEYNIFEKMKICICENSDDLNVLADLGWCLSNITSDMDSSIGDPYLKNGLHTKILDTFILSVSQHAHCIQLVTSFLRCTGNLFANLSWHDVNCHGIELKNILSSLDWCLSNTEYPHLSTEALWILSNLTCEPAFCQEFVDKKFLCNLLEHAAPHNILATQEVLICMCNLISQDHPSIIQSAVESDIILKLPALLCSDVESTKLSLQCLEVILYFSSDKVVVMQKFDLQNGTKTLRLLRDHENQEIVKMAQYLLDNYWELK